MTEQQRPDGAPDFEQPDADLTDSSDIPDLEGEVWDVVVVGAGPAGSSAAHAAASAGCRTLLLEKAELPRYKTCGGGIIGESRKALPEGVKLPLRDRVSAVTFTMRSGSRFTRRHGGTLFGLVNRAEFDKRLADAAVERGAVLVTGAAVASVAPSGGTDAAAAASAADRAGAGASGGTDPAGGAGSEGGAGSTGGAVAVRLADGRRVRARAVVGADGSASRVGRYVGVRFDQVDLGLEAEIPVPPEVAADFAGGVRIDWGPIPGSYGWVFPKGDVLTVGVIAARGQGGATRAYLDEFVARLGLSGFTPAISSGHLTRCRAADSPLARGRVLVAGDAAGLLEPWTREGISYALRSGRLAGGWAARVAAEPDDGAAAREAAGYGTAVLAGLGLEMAAGRRLLSAFERRPALFHWAVGCFPPAWRAFTAVVSGRTSFAEALRKRRAISRMVALLEK